MSSNVLEPGFLLGKYELEQTELALWILEQARPLAADKPAFLRLFGQVHENRREWKRALEYWQRFGELEPLDREAQRKINDLAAQDHLASGHYAR